MKKIRNKVAAITGAASGIGRATAIELAKCGCHLAISDVNEVGLKETARLAAEKEVRVTTHVVNVAEKEAVYSYADEAADLHGTVNIIINNAGVALGAPVETIDYEDFEWLMGINFWGVVYGTKAFLPYLKKADEGHVVNISSIFGFVGAPTQSAYNAAKFAVRGFTESLRQEMILAGNHIQVSCVHPGGIKTNIAKSARMSKNMQGYLESRDTLIDSFEKVTLTTPEQAGKIIVKGILKDNPRILVGIDAYMIDHIQRFLPKGYQNLLVAGTKTLNLKH